MRSSGPKAECEVEGHGQSPGVQIVVGERIESEQDPRRLRPSVRPGWYGGGRRLSS